MVSTYFSASSIEPVTAKTVFNGIDLLFLEVNRLEETLAFYHDQLGFEIEKVDYDSEPPMATVHAGRLRITMAQQLETMLRRGRGVSFFIGVDDVDRYHRELSDRGVNVAAPADEGWGGRFITIEDPDKYRLFFVTWSAAS
jgi:predicted enzyme related to lactoylglutathione lyase